MHGSRLRCGNFYHAGDQWMLRFEEKGGKSREVPVRHDLQQMITAYIEAAALQRATKDAPLFRAAIGTTGKLAATALHPNDICRMMKRRLKAASLPLRLSPHSFRVAVITDLLERVCRSMTCSTWPATPTRAPRGSTTSGRKK